MTLDLLRVILPRFERPLGRRNDSWGEVRKGGAAPLRVRERWGLRLLENFAAYVRDQRR
jgi:hypothetical protein